MRKYSKLIKSVNNYRQYIEAFLGWFLTSLARAKGEEKNETISYVQFYSIYVPHFFFMDS